MNVAAVQFRSLESAEQSRTKLEATLGAADLGGCDLVVLPEASQCQLARSGSIAAEPEPLDGPFVELLCRHAARLGATLVAGMFEDAGAGSLPFNTTVVVGPAGPLGAYRKTHLYDALGARESRDVRPGPVSPQNVVCFEIGGFTVGIQTCFDLRFPEVTRMLVDVGADVLVLGAAWYDGPSKLEQWQALTAARAIESTSFVVAAAQPSPVFCGTSRILDPRGCLLAEAQGDGEAILTAELEADLLSSVRAEMPVLALRRLGVTAEI